MHFIADLHIHSCFSRATAKDLNLESLNLWGQLKGLQVLGTGDFTHPGWFAELKEKLEEAEEGLFALKEDYAKATRPLVPSSCVSPIRFILSAEISSIYKKDGKTRKVHNLVLVPDFDTAIRINQALERIGNLSSDGRPILGLDPKVLLQIVLEASDEACFIPAHIWTPWFSVLGSRSGFDSLEACFDDLLPYIFALETGLSSDPAMNWCLSTLDRFALVSNSDAHSPAKIAREANRFNTELSFGAMKEALKTKQGFEGTIEFFPEEGKYHFDGHRKCQMRMHPKETMASGGRCPVCGRPVTIGVMHRVTQLADRDEGERPEGALSFISLLSLPEVLAEVLGAGPSSKKVQQQYRRLLERLGPELQLLIGCDLDKIENVGSTLLAEGINRMRKGEIQVDAGYDGEFGEIHLFSDEERSRLSGQQSLLNISTPELDADRRARPRIEKKTQESPVEHLLFSPPLLDPDGQRSLNMLNKAQQEAVLHQGGPLMIVAGPGTGKTRTLTHRIAHLIIKGFAKPEEVLAVTFTQKAANEMRRRFDDLLLDPRCKEALTVTTFHGLCYRVLRDEEKKSGNTETFTLFTESDKAFILRSILDEFGIRVRQAELRDYIQRISLAKQRLLFPSAVFLEDETLSRIFERYDRELDTFNGLDLDDLLIRVVVLFEKDSDVLFQYRKRFPFVFVDEYQDINFAQYRVIRLLSPRGEGLCVIGDPDQAIYGFRGADRTYFLRFQEDYDGASVIFLEQNYRSTEIIIKAAGQVIRGTSEWPSRNQRSAIEGDQKVIICEFPDDKAEAEFVVSEIDRLVGGTSHRAIEAHRNDELHDGEERGFGDFAVLYRIHAVGHSFEEAFARWGVPYQRMGERSLDEQEGIREVLGCLGLFLRKRSNASLLQLFNFMTKPVPEKEAFQAFMKECRRRNWGLIQGLLDLENFGSLNRKQKEALKKIGDPIISFMARARPVSVTDKILMAIEGLQIERLLADRFHDQAVWESRLRWLLEEASRFGHDLDGFLASTALRSGVDLHDERAEKVSLMTLHASKGLEFPIVFIVGCEEGLIPYLPETGERSIDEERRLFYVGLTRAMERFYLCHALTRRLFGRLRQCTPSPFLDTIKEDILQRMAPLSKKKRGNQAGKKQLSLFE